MKLPAKSPLRTALLLLTTSAAALGVMLGLPAKKAGAAALQPLQRPGPDRVREPMLVIQPRFVNPSALPLLRIAQEAMSNPGLQERIFNNPDGVAAQYHLSPSEQLVLRHMDRVQFQVARSDAQRLVASRLASGERMPPGATDVGLITKRMVVGRAILAAVGRSYQEAASANACCPWSKAIEVGVGGDPALYNSGFARPGLAG